MILSKRRSVYISIDAFLLNFICFESEWGVLQTEYYSLFLVITYTFTKRSQYQEKQNVSNYFLLFLISNKKIKKLKAAVNLIFQERVFHKLEENNILVGDIDIRVNLGAKRFSGSNLNFGCPLGYVHAIPDNFSCRDEKGIRYSRNTDPVNVTLHFKRSARFNFAPLQKSWRNQC